MLFGMVSASDGGLADTLVNVRDPNSGRTAVVNTRGALTMEPSAPDLSFSRIGQITNFYKNGSQYQTVFAATTAWVALNRIVYTNGISNASAWEVFVYYESPCQQFSSNHTVVAHANVPARESFSDPFPTPIVLKPVVAGQPWCIVAGGGPTYNTASTADSNSLDVALSGFVVAGKLSTLGPSAARTRPTLSGN